MNPLAVLNKKQLFNLQFKYTKIDEIGKFLGSREWWSDEDIWLELIENYQNMLTEDFLGDFIEKVTWVNVYYICEHYELSEEFMKKHKYYLHWPTILKHQKLTLSFLDEMSVYLNYLDRKKFLPQGILDEVRENLKRQKKILGN